MRLRAPLWVTLASMIPLVAGADDQRDPAKYEPRFLDPDIEELRDREQKRQEVAGERTAEIRKRQQERKEKERKDRQTLVSALPPEARPASPKAFMQIFHHPPQAQFMTGTCWSFATTSMLESESQRITGKRIKLSELHTVYFEYLEKVRRFVQERGDSLVGEGSQANAVLRVWERYGAVPLSAYAGVVAKDPRHDHQRLSDELQQLLDFVKREELWDEPTVLAMASVLLNRHLGVPPTRFKHRGRTYTPKQFMTRVLKVDPSDYVSVMSTTSMPFFQRGEFKVPDNWWHAADYHNVPLDLFSAALKGAIQGGYGLTVAIDVSEPGKLGPSDVMFVPSFDIPGSHIDQDAREYRIEGGLTTDDHGVHLVGYTTHGGHDWFLVKDSGRSSRRGAFKGYYFMRDDYVQLKMLAYLVHRDAVASLLKKFPQ